MAPPSNRAQLAIDASVVLLATIANLVPVQLSVGSFRAPFDTLMFAALTTSALALWFRRRAAVVVAWIVAGPVVLAAAGFAIIPEIVRSPAADPDVGALTAPVPFAVHALMVSATGARRWVPIGFLVMVALLGANPLAAGGQIVAMIGAPAALGLYTAARRRLLLALRERAERAEREGELLAERVLAEERARLAAEVHDVVTHRLSLMVLRAGALRLETTDAATRAAAEELRSTGCLALEELRDLVGVLHAAPRAPTLELEPVPPIADLVHASVSVGVPVEVIEEGEARLVSPAVGRTVYRVVQEALTNVRRHAPGAAVELSLRYRADGVRVIARNKPSPDARAPVQDGLPAGSRTGLLGLRRRIDLLGGTFQAAPLPAGGFEVEAVLPLYVRSPA